MARHRKSDSISFTVSPVYYPTNLVGQESTAGGY